MTKQDCLHILPIIVCFNFHSLFGQWQTYTSMFEMNDICEYQEQIWCATTGGVAAFDPATENFSYWTNTEGLANNEVASIICDPSGLIWLGMKNGLIQTFSPQTSQWREIQDYENYQIRDLYLTGDSLFVGLDIGISLYLVSSHEVKETYHHLGQAFQVEIPVNDILIFDNKIWASTDEGIACSDLSLSNLLDPANWTNVVSIDTANQIQVSSFHVFQDTLYAGTDSGPVKLIADQWVLANSGFPQQDALDITDHQSMLFSLTEQAVYQWNGQSWSLYGNGLQSANQFISTGSVLWIATDRGLTVSNPSWIQYFPNTPAENRFEDLAVDQTGLLWCATSRFEGSGFSGFDGSLWSIYDKYSHPGLISNTNDDIYSVAIDHSNNKWFGTWGGGIIRLNADSTFLLYNTGNGFLSGIPNYPDYAVVTDIVLDATGAVWLLNYYSLSGYPLVSVTPNEIWTYYGSSDGLSSTFLKCLTVDTQGRKWIGSEDQGVFVLDDRGTPADKSDDFFAGTLTTSDGLESNDITALAADRTGGIWIGTSKGLYYFDGNVERRYGLPADNITALTVDGVNNLWVGTDVGVTFFPSETYYGTHYSTENSALVSNNVTSLALNYINGLMYIGTSHGLSCLETPYSEPREDLSALSVYPNPFHPENDPFLIVDNLTWNVSIHIYSSAGFLIRQFSSDAIQGKQLKWDGTNQAGKQVSSGIYYIVANIEEGERKVSKLAVIR